MLGTSNFGVYDNQYQKKEKNAKKLPNLHI